MPSFLTPNSDSLPLPADNVREAWPPPKKGAKKKPPVKAKADEDVEADEDEIHAGEGDDEEPDEEEPDEDAPPTKKKGKKVVVTLTTEGRRGGEIHSAKAHRCVDKVTAKGGAAEPWAVCTASMGKDAVYARGHGGSASPKRRVREAADCRPDDPLHCPNRADSAKCRECVAKARRAVEAEMDAIVDRAARLGRR